MTIKVEELYSVLRQIRYDATAIQAKVTETVNMLNALGLPEDRPEFVCERCQQLGFSSGRKLAEHRYLIHGGPDPAVAAGGGTREGSKT